MSQTELWTRDVQQRKSIVQELSRQCLGNRGLQSKFKLNNHTSNHKSQFMKFSGVNSKSLVGNE